MENSNRYLPLLGRVMIGAPFILSGQAHGPRRNGRIHR
jgi:hypothetical protein